MRETDSDTRKRRATGQENGIVEQKKSKMAGESGANLPKESVSSSTNEEEKFFVYNLWRFGKLKLLIRCSVDAYRAEPNKPNCFTFFSVLPKLEYQANFGHEKLTCCEIARLWLHCYIRPNTKLICGRINVFNSELLRVDELFVNDILQQGVGFHPAQGMKMVFQVFQALKRLPESKFILSHKSGEIHGCLYKSMLSSSASLKSSYDFHKTRTPVVVNYTEADIPG
ncbi:ER membrane protein with type-III transmembrane domains [Desmophyllum pertusum]|uniref:ER membrane protein with type-III transmembrane domains n=1 Tax=Desmophyllum pertusum TaxID=174260 RepID=A0A9W9YVK5_9CNID|nr:ER membrane protein with type-III transmembrane domains [Desmophyllum pertusum]